MQIEVTIETDCYEMPLYWLTFDGVVTYKQIDERRLQINGIVLYCDMLPSRNGYMEGGYPNCRIKTIEVLS